MIANYTPRSTRTPEAPIPSVASGDGRLVGTVTAEHDDGSVSVLIGRTSIEISAENAQGFSTGDRAALAIDGKSVRLVPISNDTPQKPARNPATDSADSCQSAPATGACPDCDSTRSTRGGVDYG